MKYLIILSSFIFLCSCKSKYSQPLQTVIKENFNENNHLKKTKFIFQKQKRIYNLKHNLKPDTLVLNQSKSIIDADLYYNHDYLYSFKADSFYYNIAEIEKFSFIIHQVKKDSVVKTILLDYAEEDSIPFTKW